jgi:hypothetical protein
VLKIHINNLICKLYKKNIKNRLIIIQIKQIIIKKIFTFNNILNYNYNFKNLKLIFYYYAILLLILQFEEF